MRSIDRLLSYSIPHYCYTQRHASGGKQRGRGSDAWCVRCVRCVRCASCAVSSTSSQRRQQVMHRALAARGDAPVLHLYEKASAVHTVQYSIDCIYLCRYTRRPQCVIEQNSLRPSPERCLHLHTPAPLATYRSPATTRGESADGRCHSGNSDCVSLHDALFESPYLRKTVTGQPQHKYVMRPGRQYLASLVAITRTVTALPSQQSGECD